MAVYIFNMFRENTYYDNDVCNENDATQPANVNSIGNVDFSHNI